MPLALTGTGYGLIGLVIIVVSLMFFFFARHRA